MLDLTQLLALHYSEWANKARLPLTLPVHALRCVCTRARYHLSEKRGRPPVAQRMPRPQLPCAPKLFGACDGCDEQSALLALPL